MSEQAAPSRRRFVSLIAGGAASTALISAPFVRTAHAATKVRFAGQTFSAEMGRIVAKELGYDKEFGVDWDFQIFRGANEISETLISGRSDSGGIGSFASIAMGANDAPVRVAFAYAYGGNRTALIARKGSDIKSVKDLIGRKVGSRFGGIDHAMLMMALSKAGIKQSQLELINMKAEDIPAGLAANLIDAASGTEPSNSVWVEKGLGDVVFRGGQYMAAYAFGHLTTPFMEKSPEAAYATVLAYAKAMHWGRQNEADAAKLVAKVLKQDEKTVASSMRWLVYDPRLKPLAQQSEQESAALLKDLGRIRKIPDFSVYHHKALIERAEKEHPELFADLDAYAARKEKQT